ncbi:exodeoxyribonuclease V subunit alpha [Tessaracoccus flavus]|uniref:RecBCD enzyme subunit RecD n=1 Tax=Tessaracoccus flavus TaxID=1610493 RepID=A0A1Q2CEN2_9ACTN|nr:exodeoxyribonuclease V subunit alpha [Tessaracoccus flavus]AQP44579.1 exodeoxyribonuclease V subunit alpha [Tessaracoccus flavus]SDZ09288.1 DNA helicase/exodeoxyribonuclease V, alpha subunit [Tessaracoccus flavus]
MNEIPIAATGLLRSFCEAAMLHPVDFHLARRLSQLCGESDPEVQLALALATRELRLGSVCLDLDTAATDLTPDSDSDDGSVEPAAPLAWPDPERWLSSVAASPAVAQPGGDSRPFRLDGSLLYLDRYWRQERRLADQLDHRTGLAPLGDRRTAPQPLPGLDADPQQDEAVLAALNLPTTVITGGPGTGKTTIVARILAALADESPRVALAAPTGRAAGQLESSVGQLLPGSEFRGQTLHRLLGARPRSHHVDYGPNNPLPYDVVVVDETSMVSLELMADLLSAIGDETRLILLGDPHQLRSVEAGAVLADIERAGLLREPGARVVRLRRNRRSNLEIGALAEAVLAGDASAALDHLDSLESLNFVAFSGAGDPWALPSLADDALAAAAEVQSHALRGDGVAANRALRRHRILAGHREGPYGVGHWGASVRRGIAQKLDGYGHDTHPYPGQPLLILANSDLFSNGDTAVVVREGTRLTAHVDSGSGPRLIDPALLDDATDLHAMTIHKSQGSQFSAVSVVLPPQGSPLLTRELLYTAVTRARDKVTIYGTREAFADAVATPVRRASGL